MDLNEEEIVDRWILMHNVVSCFTVKEIQAFLCFCIFVKSLKIQNGHHFWKEENSVTIRQSNLLKGPSHFHGSNSRPFTVVNLLYIRL